MFDERPTYQLAGAAALMGLAGLALVLSCGFITPMLQPPPVYEPESQEEETE